MTRSAFTRSKTCRLFLLSASLLGTASTALAQNGSCKDPWIKMVYNAVYKRNPTDPSNNGVSGECNINLYGNGHWSNYQDLTNKVIAHTGPPPSSQAVPVIVFHIDRNYNVDDPQGKTYATKGSYTVIGSNGSPLTAAQLAAIVAQGGGNYRLESTGGAFVFKVR